MIPGPAASALDLLLTQKLWSWSPPICNLICSLGDSNERLHLRITNVVDRAFLVAQLVKNPPTMQKTQVQSLSGEDPLEKEMAIHSSILAWKIPWTEEPGGLYSPWGHQELVTT